MLCIACQQPGILTKIISSFMVTVSKFFSTAVNCTGGKVYKECGSLCVKTCANAHRRPHCYAEDCVDGCFCPDGKLGIESSAVEEPYHHNSFVQVTNLPFFRQIS